MSTGKSFWRRSWQIEAPVGLLLAVLTLALIASNVVLQLQNRALKQARQTVAEPVAESVYLAPGQAVPRLRGLDLQGQSLSFELGEGARSTVLLVFQPDCGWCQKNMANWTALLNEADENQFRFLAVATRPTGVADYVDEHPQLSALPLIAEPEPNDRLQYRLFDTPQTIVINRQGIVEKLWLGAMSGPALADVESYFGVTLPGIGSAG